MEYDRIELFPFIHLSILVFVMSNIKLTDEQNQVLEPVNQTLCEMYAKSSVKMSECWYNCLIDVKNSFQIMCVLDVIYAIVL